MVLMMWAIDVLQEYIQKEAILRNGANLQNILQYGLMAGTRLHEAGIPSNRKS